MGALVLMAAFATTAAAQTTLDPAITSNGGDVRILDGGGEMFSTIGEPMASDSINTLDNGTTWTGFWQVTPIGGVGSVRDGEAGNDAATGIVSATPEPFTSQVVVGVVLAKPSVMELAVYDLQGSYVGTLTSGFREAGTYRVAWRPESIAAGSYMVTLLIDGEPAATRLVRYVH